MSGPVTQHFGPNSMLDAIERDMIGLDDTTEAFISDTTKVVDSECGESYEAVRGFCSALTAISAVLVEADTLGKVHAMTAVLIAATRRSTAVRAAIAYEAKMEG